MWLKISKRNNHPEIEVDPIVGIEMIQEIDTETETEIEIGVETEVEIEVEIEGIVETIVETEEDQTQEKVETTNRDLVQVKDTLTKKISVNTVTEQVIQHIGVSNLKTI